MSTQGDINTIKDLMARLDASRVARFSYTEKALTDNTIEGVSAFNVTSEQNVPLGTLTDFNETVLDKGLRAQGAGLPRMAQNHFFGRVSYNLNKLIEQFKAYLQLDMASRAHNAGEYDPVAPYRQNDICYTIDTVGSTGTVSYYIRKSSTPAVITGIPPTDTSHWKDLMLKSVGAHAKYVVADLSELDNTKWYPVTTKLGDLGVGVGKDLVQEVRVEVYVGSPAVSELSVVTRFPQGSEGPTDIVYCDSTAGSPSGSTSPIGYSKLVNGKQVVVWLKGGSTYSLWNSYGSDLTTHTASYANGLDDAIAPSSTRVFESVPTRIRDIKVGTFNGVVPGAGGLSLLSRTVQPNSEEEYSNLRAYRQGDTCYVIGLSDAYFGYTTKTSFIRSGDSPETIMDVPTTDRSQWKELLPRTSGARAKTTIVDLTVENPNYWFPAATRTYFGYEAFEMGDTPLLVKARVFNPEEPLPRSFLSVLTVFTADRVEDIVLGYADNNVPAGASSTTADIGYSTDPTMRAAIVYLRGGKTYELWNSAGRPFTVWLGHEGEELPPYGIFLERPFLITSTIAPTRKKVISITTAASFGGFAQVDTGIPKEKVVGLYGIIPAATGGAILGFNQTSSDGGKTVFVELYMIGTVVVAANGTGSTSLVWSRPAHVVVEYLP